MQTSFRPLLLGGGGVGGVKSVSRGVTVNSKEENSLRLLFQIPPRIRPLYTEFGQLRTQFASIQYSSLQLSILAETIDTASHFKPLKHGKMRIRVTALSFDLCVLYYSSPCIPIIPSPVKHREKRVTSYKALNKYNVGLWLSVGVGMQAYWCPQARCECPP